MSNPSPQHIPAFHAVMTHGSLSAAARALRLAQPTVRRHIEALEDELGTALFTRAVNGLTPTAKAQQLLPIARAVLDQTAALGRAAAADAARPVGVVRLTASRVVATHVLPPLLARLRSDAPGLRFEIAATDAAENLNQRAADIAVRFTAPRQQALVAAKLPDVVVGLFTAPGVHRPRTPEALQEAPFISDDREDRLLPAMLASGLPVPRNIVLRCDDPLAQLAHLQAGLGIGLCQIKLAARLGLERVLPDIVYPMPAWLVVHEDQRHLPHIAPVFAHLKAHLPDLM
ncbi:LysR family transcriptional regulator [Sulfitobacter sp. JB4-11]|uniref:LysR family transcriptional regulator n=1 Tax=Sulfitobacter rhodophyticola TaxID=3238304 RepID=UPI0035149CA2